MSDLINGTFNGWPVSLMIERDAGGKAYGAHCAPYTGPDDETAPDDIAAACAAISDACDGKPPGAALRAARKLGFATN